MKKRTVILLLALTLVLSLGLTGCKKKSSHKTSNNDDEVVLTQTGNCSDGTWDELCASFDLLVDEYAELYDLDDETDIMSTLSEEEEKSVAQAADVICGLFMRFARLPRSITTWDSRAQRTAGWKRPEST